MSDAPPNDIGLTTTTPGELLAASAVAQFYTFAGQCMDWAKTTRSIQERILYGSDGSEVSGRRGEAAYDFATS